MWRISLGMLENDISSCMPGTFWTFTVCVFTSCIQSWRSLFIAAVWMWVTYSSFQFTVLCGVASRHLFSGRSETSPPFKVREASGWSLQKPKSPWIRTRWAWKVVLMWYDRYYWFLWQALYLSLPGFIFCMIFNFGLYMLQAMIQNTGMWQIGIKHWGGGVIGLANVRDMIQCLVLRQSVFSAVDIPESFTEEISSISESEAEGQVRGRRHFYRVCNVCSLLPESDQLCVGSFMMKRASDLETEPLSVLSNDAGKSVPRFMKHAC